MLNFKLLFTRCLIKHIFECYFQKHGNFVAFIILGHLIARLPCFCVYHKGFSLHSLLCCNLNNYYHFRCIDEWFKRFFLNFVLAHYHHVLLKRNFNLYDFSAKNISVWSLLSYDSIRNFRSPGKVISGEDKKDHIKVMNTCAPTL